MQRIPSLDGLRAISIAMVVLGHLAIQGRAPQMWTYYPNIGVRMFFVISGFLITTILLRERAQNGHNDLKQFYVRRGFRIFPAAFVFAFLMIAFFWQVLRWYQVIPVILYVTNYTLSTQHWVFGHLWSLSVEEQFYFLWPAVLRRFEPYKIPILIGTIAVAPLFQAFMYALKVHVGGYGMLPTVANNLAVGCLGAILAPRMPRIPKWLAVVMLGVVLTVPVFAGDTVARTIVSLFLLQPAMHVSMAGLLLHVVNESYKFLNWKPVVWLGQVSYSLYLWQQPFCYSPSARAWFGVAAALGFACLSYYCVEQPMLRMRDRRPTAIPLSEPNSLEAVPAA